MRYGYARVSTEGQRLESQIEELRRAGVDEIYQENTPARPRVGRFLNSYYLSCSLVISWS